MTKEDFIKKWNVLAMESFKNDIESTIQQAIADHEAGKWYVEIEKELQRAKSKFPTFPDDMFHQLAIMQEEAGEVTKAVLQHHYEAKPLKDVKSELIQTAAMCVRMLENLPYQEGGEG